jgi:DNA-binding transcriptional LysR family regulator
VHGCAWRWPVSPQTRRDHRQHVHERSGAPCGGSARERGHERAGRGEQPEVVRVEVALELAVAGAGIAYLPDFVVAGALAEGRLRRVLPEWGSPPLRAVAIHRAELRSAPRERAFLGAFAEPAL